VHQLLISAAEFLSEFGHVVVLETVPAKASGPNAQLKQRAARSILARWTALKGRVRLAAVAGICVGIAIAA